MSFPSGTYIDQIQDPAVRAEFQMLYSLFYGYLSTQHEQDGSHGNVTAKSVFADANTETGATGTITADANITADADGTPVVMGNHAQVGGARIGSGLDLQYGAVSRWRMLAANSGSNERELLFEELVGNPGSYTFRVYWDATNSEYALEPDILSTMRLGSAASSKRWSAINTLRANVTQMLCVGTALSPAQITADQNNYNPTGFLTSLTVILTSDAARTITGFAAGTTGQRMRLLNNGSFTITLAYNSASSSGGNRLVAPGRVNYGLVQGGGVDLEYQSGAWFVCEV